MLKKLNKKQGAFTLVEIMFVVAIIALLASIALPNFIRARKRAQATKILEDLRIIDAAIDLYAIETNKIAGVTPSFEELMPYMKKGSSLYSSKGKDMFGKLYSDGNFTVDVIPFVNADTFNTLSDVAPIDFWSPYNHP